MNVVYKFDDVIYFKWYLIGDVLRDLVPFVQFKRRQNTYGRMLLLVRLNASDWNFTENNTPPMGVFHVFQILEMVANPAKHYIYIFDELMHSFI